MCKAIQETGNQYGRLTVIGRAGSKDRSALWLCRCNCGKEVVVKGKGLRSGKTRSCGCLRAEVKGNLVGQKFGRLTVLSRAPRPEETSTRESYWNCACECGGSKVVARGSLRRGHTKSCGCLQLEQLQKLNGYEDLSGVQFGRWTALKRVPNPYGKKEVYFLCRCACGTERPVLASGLRNGGSQSCGCLAAELSRERRSLDLTAQQFGRLTVIAQYSELDKFGRSQWKCSCSCGKKVIATTNALRSGHTKSCGCLAYEYALRNLHAVQANMKKHEVGTRRIMTSGYVQVKCPGHPNATNSGWVYEHILVICQKHNLEKLPERWSVHHRDCNKQNNSPDNLELWTGNHPTGVRASDLDTFCINHLRISKPEALAKQFRTIGTELAAD